MSLLQFRSWNTQSNSPYHLFFLLIAALIVAAVPVYIKTWHLLLLYPVILLFGADDPGGGVRYLLAVMLPLFLFVAVPMSIWASLHIWRVGPRWASWAIAVGIWVTVRLYSYPFEAHH